MTKSDAQVIFQFVAEKTGEHINEMVAQHAVALVADLLGASGAASAGLTAYEQYKAFRAAAGIAKWLSKRHGGKVPSLHTKKGRELLENAWNALQGGDEDD